MDMNPVLTDRGEAANERTPHPRSDEASLHGSGGDKRDPRDLALAAQSSVTLNHARRGICHWPPDMLYQRVSLCALILQNKSQFGAHGPKNKDRAHGPWPSGSHPQGALESHKPWSPCSYNTTWGNGLKGHSWAPCHSASPHQGLCTGTMRSTRRGGEMRPCSQHYIHHKSSMISLVVLKEKPVSLKNDIA